MKILSPLSSKDEVKPLADAGAGEFYCGVLDRKWREKYTNVASPNRREWTRSNLPSYDQLKETVKRAHHHGIQVFLTLNALYTKVQMDMLKRELEIISKIPVDALIVADLGLLILLREMAWKGEIHLSTGATVFNSETAKFYKDNFNISRIAIPRHHSLKEIVSLSEKLSFIHLECFIFNSGCRNIDGLCTYHHGANEILHGAAYSIPKQLGIDYLALKALRMLPDETAARFSRIFSGRSDSACLLNWNAEAVKPNSRTDGENKKAQIRIQSSFCLRQGLDPCGACHIPVLHRANIGSLKIVGRENPTDKKIKDVGFLSKMLKLWESGSITEEEFKTEARRQYRIIYGVPCRDWCYYPEAEKLSLIETRAPTP